MPTLLLTFLSLLLMSFNCAAQNSQSKLSIKQFKVNHKIYQLEIAKTSKQLQLGLMGRKYIANNDGMLFVFPQIKRHGIWMKNMSIPLTVAWLDQQFNVIHVEKLKPCQQLYCPVYKPNKPSSYVVELNVNEDIKVGEKFKIVN